MLIVAAGITLFEALKAADTLAAAGVKVSVQHDFLPSSKGTGFLLHYVTLFIICRRG